MRRVFVSRQGAKSITLELKADVTGASRALAFGRGSLVWSVSDMTGVLIRIKILELGIHRINPAHS